MQSPFFLLIFAFSTFCFCIIIHQKYLPQFSLNFLTNSTISRIVDNFPEIFCFFPEKMVRAPDLVFAPTLACWRVRKRVALTTASLGTAGRTYT